MAETAEVKGFDSYPVRLGDLMRGERATLGKSLLDVQRDLRIKAAYIAAIENCDASAFHTPGFISGYVRSYARYLNLEPEPTFAQFCAEAGFDGVHADVSRPKPAKKPRAVADARNKPTDDEPLVMPHSPFGSAGDGIFGQVSASALGSILVLAILIAGIGYGAWSVLQDIQRVELTSGEEGRIVAVPAPAIAPINEETRVSGLDRLYRPEELEVPVMTPRDGPIAALDPDKTGALVQANGTNAAREMAERMKMQMPRVTEIAPPKVAVVARRPAWIRVSLADGTILFEKILDSGESFQMPENAGDAVLRAGNSGEVFLSLDGAPYGPIGADTSVVKNVALGPLDIVKTFTRVSDRKALEALDSPRVITLNQ